VEPVAEETELESTQEEKPVDAEAPAEGAEASNEAEKEEKPAEEEDNEIDYATYLERKKKEEEELRQLFSNEIRKVDQVDLKDMKPLAKEEENFFPIDGKKKSTSKKSPQPRNDKVQADDLLHFQAPPPRDGRDRRGRGRQDRGRGKRGGGQVSLSLTDDRDFPTLGVKA